MADKKISELAAASALVGTEVVPVVQSSATKKATITQVLAAAQPLDADLTAIAALTSPATIISKAPRPLFYSTTTVGNVGTGVDDLHSHTIAAGQLAADGDRLEFEFGGQISKTDGATTIAVSATFGGTEFMAFPALDFEDGAWFLNGSITRASATAVRVVAAGSVPAIGAPGLPVTGASVQILTGLTLSNTNILKVTGAAAGAGAANDDIECYVSAVRYIPAP